MFLTKNSKNTIGLFAAVLALLIIPENAHALTLEFYTYGGFADAVHAFTKVALIFNDSVYQSLLPTVFVLSLATALLDAGIYSLLTEVKAGGVQIAKSEGIYSAFVNAMIGAIIFIGLMVPKGTLQIHDPNSGATQEVGNIPLLAVVSAGAGNLIQRAIVGAVDTAGDPLGYSKQSGMKSMQVINSIMTRSDSRPAGMVFMGQTMQAYLTDCVGLAVTLPATGLTVDEILATTADLMVSFEKAASLANYTTIFDAASPQGTGGTCANSYNTFKTIPDPLTVFADTIEQACADANYKVYDATNGPSELTTCKGATDALLQAIVPGVDLGKFVTQAYQANQAYFALVNTMPNAIVEKQNSTYNKQSILAFFRTMGQKQGMLAAFSAMMLPFFWAFTANKVLEQGCKRDSFFLSAWAGVGDIRCGRFRFLFIACC